MKEIKFYEVDGEYGYFSNLAPFPVGIEEKVWLTVENYYQAKKFEDHEIQDRIRCMRSPMDAIIEGRKDSNKIVSNWNEIKEEVMLEALKAKFSQHPSLRKNLLNTGDAIIIEHTSSDDYWADGGDGKGRNRLGYLIMEVRQYLLSIDERVDIILPLWIAFPGVKRISMFWRMGMGEDYLTKYSEWLYSLTLEERRKYASKFPPPLEWEGYFQKSTSGE